MRRSVAILGAGIGEKHLAAYAQLPDRFVVTHICDLNLELAQRLAFSADAKVCQSIDEILADASIELIDICLPPPLHVPIALKALAAGKHVVLEKPIAGSLREADRLVEAQARSSGRVFPIFQYRFGRAFETIGRIRQAGFLDKPLAASLETHWNRGEEYYDNPWRGTWEHELGGAVLSHAIHVHDLLSVVFGAIEEVSAVLATRANPIETEDCAAIAFRMKNGATATSSITLGAADDTSRLRFVFSDITIESARLPYTPGEANWCFQSRDPSRQAEIDELVSGVGMCQEGFTGFCTAVADALDGRLGTEVTLADGVAAVELATAIYQSDRCGSRVALPVDRTLAIAAGFKP